MQDIVEHTVLCNVKFYDAKLTFAFYNRLYFIRFLIILSGIVLFLICLSAWVGFDFFDHVHVNHVSGSVRLSVRPFNPNASPHSPAVILSFRAQDFHPIVSFWSQLPHCFYSPLQSHCIRSVLFYLTYFSFSIALYTISHAHPLL